MKNGEKKNVLNIGGKGSFVRVGKHEREMVGGVGFIISTAVQKYVEAIDIISSGIAVLKMRFPNRRKMSIYEVHSPHSGYDGAEIETFYEELETYLEKDKAHYQIVMSDFNAELGEKQHDEKFIGKHGLGERNDNTGARLAIFFETRHLNVINTYSKKTKAEDGLGRHQTYKSSATG